MKHTELTWKTNDGIKIFGQKWESGNVVPKAVICLVHGFGEHSSRYEHVAQMFTDNSFAVISYDHRGHGKSDGQKGHFSSYEEFMNDVGLLLKQADTNFPGLPKIIYAHSMGGNVAANYVIQKKPDIKGLILSSPFFKPAFTPPAIKLAVGKLMKNIVPAFSLPSGVDATAISRDKAVVEKYKKDPLVFDLISSKMGIELLEFGEQAVQQASQLKIPALLFHGSGDKLTSFEKSREFAKNAGSIVTFHEFPGWYHETHNEPEKERVFELVLHWCNQILK